MDLGLAGRVVIVTGASGGIGRALARAFAAEGAEVVLTYNNSRADADDLAAQLGGSVLVRRYALQEPDSAALLTDEVVRWAGRIDVLVNNAVLFDGPSSAAFEEVPDEVWTDVVRYNVEGMIALSRSAGAIMRKQGWGRLVHISSSTVVEGMPGMEYYSAAKAALHGFSRSVAFSLGRDGDILSNVVMPGFTRTERNEQWPMFEGASAAYVPKVPIGRLLTAAEVATAVVFLASAANAGINGQVIAVTGGA